MWLLTLILACDREDFYAEPSLYENVKEVYTDCSKDQISFLKKKTNIQTVFEDCGSNNVFDFDWSLDGKLFYFHLFKSSYILNPTNKGVDHLPLETPLERGVWLNATQIVLPTASKTSEMGDLIFYTVGSGLTNAYPLIGKDPKDVQAFDSKTILLTLVDESGKRRPYFFTEMTGKFEPAFEFAQDCTSLQVAPKGNLVTCVDEKGTHVMDLQGNSIAELPVVKRAIPHPNGQYIALEVDGAPVSPLDKGTGTYKSPEAQKREEARRKQQLENLPDWMPKEIIPQEIQVYSLAKKERYRFTKFYGEHFVWYGAQDYYCSFTLHGLDGHFINQNVSLMDLAVPLMLAERGDFSSAIELVQ